MNPVRTIVVGREGVALAELLDGDRELLDAASDGAFEPDPDDRPPLGGEMHVERLAVIDQDTGELLGQVNWHAEGYGRTVGCAAWNIGISLVPGARGRGVGTRAQRLLVEHLFATTPVDRVEASTESANMAEQRALLRAGFRAEGVIRGAQPRGGVRRDFVLYGVLRTDLLAPVGERTVVARRDGVALAQPLPGDRERIFKDTASEFDLDADHRPRPTLPARSSWLTVLDAVDGTVLGGVSWHAVDYGGTAGCSAWNIGIGLLPGARRRGIGTTAQRLLAEHLFATTELDRVEASTDVDNLAEQRALERAGFRREGVIRGAQLRGGRRRDVAHFGVLRTDLPRP